MQKHKAKMSLLIQPIVRALLLPALLFSYELAYAELNLPPSTKSITAQIKESHPGQFNKKSTANPTGTDKKPLVVENLEAERTRERLEKERPYEEE